jgi:hypothetical protein
MEQLINAAPGPYGCKLLGERPSAHRCKIATYLGRISVPRNTGNTGARDIAEIMRRGERGEGLSYG